MAQKRSNDAEIGEGAPGAVISETAGGIPDEAIGPEQRSVPELLELTGGETAAAMAAKLAAEVRKRRWGHRPASGKTIK